MVYKKKCVFKGDVQWVGLNATSEGKKSGKKIKRKNDKKDKSIKR